MKILPSNPTLYAAIDLGSNSFHMLIVQSNQGQTQVMAKIKRKVRLAAGLNDEYLLQAEAMQRGWDALSLFAEILQDVPREQISIVATATLRYAKNASEFTQKANQILNAPIRIIGGDEEAALIYQGVAYTSAHCGKRLVVDIGGASTEIICGENAKALMLSSTEMGCVSWLEKYFSDHKLNPHNFEKAIQAAKEKLKPVKAQFKQQTWQICEGASGTVQAVQEILMAQSMGSHITLGTLKQIKNQAIACQQISDLHIDGLAKERELVFPSGLAILMAIFEVFSLQSIELAGGALREGLLYSMLDGDDCTTIKERTCQNLQRRFQTDRNYAEQVKKCSTLLFKQYLEQSQKTANADEFLLLSTAAQLHEIGKSVNFKNFQCHSAYLLTHSELTGFNAAQKQSLINLVRCCHGKLTAAALTSLNRNEILLLTWLRLGVLLSHRRSDNKAPEVRLIKNNDRLQLFIEPDWLAQNPLTNALMLDEFTQQRALNWPIQLSL